MLAPSAHSFTNAFWVPKPPRSPPSSDDESVDSEFSTVSEVIEDAELAKRIERLENERLEMSLDMHRLKNANALLLNQCDVVRELSGQPSSGRAAAAATTIQEAYRRHCDDLALNGAARHIQTRVRRYLREFVNDGPTKTALRREVLKLQLGGARESLVIHEMEAKGQQLFMLWTSERSVRNLLQQQLVSSAKVFDAALAGREASFDIAVNADKTFVIDDLAKWQGADFATLEKPVKITSPPFAAKDTYGGMQWYIEVFPMGNEIGRNTHLALYLGLHDAAHFYSKSKTIDVSFDLSVVGKEKVKTLSFKKKLSPLDPPERADGAWCMLRLDELKKPSAGWLHDGKLIVAASKIKAVWEHPTGKYRV